PDGGIRPVVGGPASLPIRVPPRNESRHRHALCLAGARKVEQRGATVDGGPAQHGPSAIVDRPVRALAGVDLSGEPQQAYDMNRLHARGRKPAHDALVLGFGFANPERPVAGPTSVVLGRWHGLARNLNSGNDLRGKVRKRYLFAFLPGRHGSPAP